MAVVRYRMICFVLLMRRLVIGLNISWRSKLDCLLVLSSNDVFLAMCSAFDIVVWIAIICHINNSTIRITSGVWRIVGHDVWQVVVRAISLQTEFVWQKWKQLCQQHLYSFLVYRERSQTLVSLKNLEVAFVDPTNILGSVLFKHFFTYRIEYTPPYLFQGITEWWNQQTFFLIFSFICRCM